ncbi:hypothetical protein [Roseicitreum antarcticum]|uniref:Uncharacterized protein n=1 Tax=Roseicitreum antarcticum TaxID=564137 RepID=A0A1H3BMJ9_9RHOB|nr:hypothetical protein [Roseicitreum antarcticum]SDX43202.1 hypothetical protein SAMN04488238_108114 [Roseicitreum antarcticum]
MLLEFIATIAAAFVLGGMALGLTKLMPGRLPAWIVPAAAGLGMIGYQVWSEYSWFDRVTGTLPDGVEVVSTNALQVWYRPWTYAVPQVSRATAVDHRFERRNPEFPEQVMTAVVLLARWEPMRQFGVVYDCAAHARADLMDEVIFAEDGAITGAEWVPVGRGDAVLQAVCGQEG